MSTEDIKIQTSPAVPAGAQEPLQDDNEQKSRCGFTGSQVFPLSGRTGTNVEGRAARLISPAANNREGASVSGLAVDSPVAPSVKQVDHLAIQGSNAPNDFRVKAAPAVMPSQPAPRQPVGQAPNSGRTPAAPAPQSFDSENVGS